MDKLLIIGQVTGNYEVAELPALDKYLQDGWQIREIQSQSCEGSCCCYVWLHKKEQE